MVTPALLAQVSPAIRSTLTTFLPSTDVAMPNVNIGLHTRNGRQVNDENTYPTRIDYLLGKQRLAVRYSYNNQTYTTPSLAQNIPTFYPLRYNNAVVEHKPMFASDGNDFGPHIGLVRSPRGSKRTVFRTGGAVNYIMPQAVFYRDMAYVDPALSFVSTFNSADTYPAALAFQNQLQANPSQLPSNLKLSRSIADYNRRDTYSISWNRTVQRQLTKDTAFQAVYVGQRARPAPSLGQINFEENAANISYHALELSVNQRPWHGLNNDAYFAWSKSIGYYTPDDTATLPITELPKIVVRLEAFSALNHPVFASPIAALNNPKSRAPVRRASIRWH